MKIKIPPYGIILMLAILLFVIYMTLVHKSSDSANNNTQPLKYRTGELIRMTIPKDQKRQNFETAYNETINIINTEELFPKEAPATAGSTVKQTGIYKTVKGDYLWKISAREDVHGDPLMWPALLMMNPDLINYMNNEEEKEIPYTALPEGSFIRYITIEQAEKNRNNAGIGLFVINVRSAQDPKHLVTDAISLIKSGYYVYCTDTEIEKKRWFRLRTGFWTTKEKAEKAKKIVSNILNNSNLWLIQIQESEYAWYAGFGSLP